MTAYKMPNAQGNFQSIAVPSVQWHEADRAAVERVRRALDDFDALSHRRRWRMSSEQLAARLRDALDGNDPSRDVSV